ncbi:Na+ dependent nucleoside transporter N-terminal domain-containing protein, partial [Parasphingorhabdus sp.]
MIDILQQGQGLIGLSLILVFVWLLSENRQARPSWKWIGGALLLQFTIAL